MFCKVKLVLTEIIWSSSSMCHVPTVNYFISKYWLTLVG